MADFTQSYDYYITKQGIIVPDTADVLSDVNSEFQTIFGADFNIEPETPQGRLIEMIARSRIFSLQTAAAVSNMLNLNKANGFVLDDLGSLFLLSRTPATHTTTTAILGGVSGTIIPAGTRFQTTGGDIFETTSDYVLGDSQGVLVQSQDTGAVACPANTLTIILDAVNGLETVNNPSAGDLGTDLESDSEFRVRIKNSLLVNSISVVDSIKANLEALPGVKGVFIYDNYSDNTYELDQVYTPGHSLLVAVDGGDSKEIAQVLYNKKTIGTGYVERSTNSNVQIITETITDNNVDYTVKFIRPELRNIAVDITVAQNSYTGTDLSSDVKSAIVNWINGEDAEVLAPNIGGNVSPFEISAAISNAIPDIFIRDVKVGDVGGTLKAETISLDAIQKAVITENNITVNIVANG